MSMEEKYFNFPVQLLKGFLVDSKEVLRNILYYALYVHTLKLEYGDEEDAINDAADYYGVSLGDVGFAFVSGEELYNSLPVNSPKVGINTSIYWDFRKNHKSEFEKVCLLGFLAIKSIVQNKTYCKLDNKYWLSRMDGKAKSVSEYYELSGEVRKYANRYQLTKIKTEIRNNWNLKTYGHRMRGFCVSFKLSLEDLVFEAEKRRKSIKEKQYKIELENARIKALNRIAHSVNN